MRIAAALALAGLLPFASLSSAQERPGDFDFYLLALSWSPSFCAGGDREAAASPQCDPGAGHGFIVHGLWPQRESGYPEFCAGERPPRIPAALAEEMRDIMPDRDLVFHAWRKHGTCTGLSPAAYFSQTRAAQEAVAVPALFSEADGDREISAGAVEAAFITANPGLPEDGIAVACEDGALAEVRICLSRDLQFRPCREVDRRGCRSNDIQLPAPM